MATIEHCIRPQQDGSPGEFGKSTRPTAAEPEHSPSPISQAFNPPGDLGFSFVFAARGRSRPFVRSAPGLAKALPNARRTGLLKRLGMEHSLTPSGAARRAVSDGPRTGWPSEARTTVALARKANGTFKPALTRTAAEGGAARRPIAARAVTR